MFGYVSLTPFRGRSPSAAAGSAASAFSLLNNDVVRQLSFSRPSLKELFRIARKAKSASKWTAALDHTAVRAAFAEATVDAYGDSEQHTGLLTLIEDELQFPFRARVLGEEVTIAGMKWPEDHEFGLDFVCERKGKRHWIEARSVELLKPFPKGHLHLAAYLEWKRRI